MVFLSVLIVVTIVTWQMIFPAAVLTFIIVILRAVYVPTARSVKRIESAGKLYMKRKVFEKAVNSLQSSKKVILDFQLRNPYIRLPKTHKHEMTLNRFIDGAIQ